MSMRRGGKVLVVSLSGVLILWMLSASNAFSLQGGSGTFSRGKPPTNDITWPMP